MVRAVYSKLAAQHRNPVPNAAILRGLLVTSGILGKRLDTDDYPADRGEQTALVFSYLEAILEEAGATPQDVIKLDLYFADKSTGPSPMNSGFACGPTRPGARRAAIRPCFRTAVPSDRGHGPACRSAERLRPWRPPAPFDGPDDGHLPLSG